jgi:hypothetical protein
MGATLGRIQIPSGEQGYEVGGLDLPLPGVVNRMILVQGHENVAAILVQTQAPTRPESFREVWAGYSPERIIARFGTPTRIMVKSFHSAGEASSTIIYLLWLFYDGRGILASYVGRVPVGPVYRMCPSYETGGNLAEHLELYLQAGDSPSPLDRFASHELSPAAKVIPLEEAAGITPSDFANMILNGDATPCFETSRDIWR